jgi:hypothetical protein
MRPILLLALFAATPLCAQAAPATPPAGGPAAFFAKADTDKNGTLSLAEWEAAGRRERGFKLLDTDSSGSMTQAELAEGVKKYGAMMPSPQ